MPVKMQISKSGILLEGKTPIVFGKEIALLDMKDEDMKESKPCFAILLEENERLAQLIQSEEWAPKIYWFDKILYIVLDHDQYHYFCNLKDNPSGIDQQIDNDKKVLLVIMKKNSNEAKWAVLEDVVTE